jgi:glycosyltransferase involved in cell wall biosynthesis
MVRIGFLVTAGPWWDQRQFHKQVPALAVPENKVFFIAGDPGGKVTDRFDFIPLSLRQRGLARYSGALNLLGLLLRLRLDALQLCSVEQLPLGFVLKLFTRVKVVYDCREDMYSGMRDHKVGLPRWARVLLASVVRAMEYAAARIFDGLVVSDTALYRLFHVVPADRKTIFFNTPLLSQFARDYPPLADRPYDVVLMGSMSRRTGLITLIEAMGILKRRGRAVKAILIGKPENAAMKIIEKRMAELDISSQVKVTGWIEYKDIPGILWQAKIGTVPLPDMPKFRRNIACKAFEYMACGMPSVVTDLPPQREFIRHGENGLFFAPDDAEAFANALELLLSDPARARQMGQVARADVESLWNAERDQRNLLDFYRQILGKRSRPRRVVELSPTGGTESV